jgi:hypothetical protein
MRRKGIRPAPTYRGNSRLPTCMPHQTDTMLLGPARHTPINSTNSVRSTTRSFVGNRRNQPPGQKPSFALSGHQAQQPRRGSGRPPPSDAVDAAGLRARRQASHSSRTADRRRQASQGSRSVCSARVCQLHNRPLRTPASRVRRSSMTRSMPLRREAARRMYRTIVRDQTRFLRARSAHAGRHRKRSRRLARP